MLSVYKALMQSLSDIACDANVITVRLKRLCLCIKVAIAENVSK